MGFGLYYNKKFDKMQVIYFDICLQKWLNWAIFAICCFDLKPLTAKDLQIIMHSKRAKLYYLEHCRVLVKDGRVLYLTEGKHEDYYYNIAIANTTCILLGTGTCITASKNTAVSCHRIKSRHRSELLWIVGSKSKFDAQGNTPVNFCQKSKQ